jgi:prolyl oligopeptidase
MQPPIRPADAPEVARASATDMIIAPFTFGDPNNPYVAIMRSQGSSDSLMDHVIGDTLVRSPIRPSDQFKGVIAGKVVVVLGTPLEDGVRTFGQGDLVACALDDVLAGAAPRWELVMPAPTSGAIADTTVATDYMIVATTEHVQTRLTKFTLGENGEWRRSPLPIEANVTAGIVAAAWGRDDYFYVSSNILTPATLYYVAQDGEARVVAQAPARFDASGFVVDQRFATSADGVQVPYFIAYPRGGTPRKVLIEAYGGFRVSRFPGYVDPFGQFWLEQGNAFVIANIRGGGEYGPNWHLSAIRENRQRAFDDLHAVAAQLRADGFTKVAMQGGSNGGLLAGVAYTQRPDLYDAITMIVPLADMRRYHQLLAGANWVAEYGNPDEPADWAFLSRYSPYHNLKADTVYPPLLLQTSTKDDRVHPAHARKMAARLEEMGKAFDYYENTEGGHGGASDNEQSAFIIALRFVWLKQALANPA